MTRKLRPSLGLAAAVLGDELAALGAAGETVRDLFADYRDGAIYVATNSLHEHGIVIFGMSDSEESAR
jgi:hypothetical protein